MKLDSYFQTVYEIERHWFYTDTNKSRFWIAKTIKNEYLVFEDIYDPFLGYSLIGKPSVRLKSYNSARKYLIDQYNLVNARFAEIM